MGILLLHLYSFLGPVVTVVNHLVLGLIILTHPQP